MLFLIELLKILGIVVGRTGVKAAIVETKTGKLLSKNTGLPFKNLSQI